MRTLPFFAGLACLLLLPGVAAWTWEDYEGTTQWRVEATDDETGCGGSLKTKDVVAIMQHKGEMVDITSLGHGRARGGFAGNKLTIPPMTIPDGSGQSKLSSADLIFTPDCMGFSGRYTWDYADSMMRCSGTTTVRGERMDAAGCPQREEPEDVIMETPEVKVVFQIKEIRNKADEAEKERRYKDILAKNPKDFWANWDMAELRKKQGNAMEFFRYFDAAAGNENIFAETREELQAETAKSLGLPEYPTPGKSPLLRFMTDDVNSWNGGLVYEQQIPKEEAADKRSWPVKLWALLNEKADKYSRTIVDKAVEEME